MEPMMERYSRVPLDPDCIIRPRMLARRLSIHPQTLWRWVREGRWPRPVRLGPNSCGWRAATVEAELKKREQ
jgi:prophage regulatory protein